MITITNAHELKFENICVGEVFKMKNIFYNGYIKLFMKIEECRLISDLTPINAVCLNDGSIYHCVDKDMVIPVPAPTIAI